MPKIIGYPVVLPDQPQLWRGDPFRWTLAMAAGEDDDGALVDPVDLTGFGTAWASTARRGGSDSVDFTIDATVAAAGLIVLSLTGEQTAALTVGSPYRFDVQASGGASSPWTVWTGQFTVAADYTHA